MNLFAFSSQEPDTKRQRVDDSSSAAANAMTDMQAGNSAYNYNWYQVSQSRCMFKFFFFSLFFLFMGTKDYVLGSERFQDVDGRTLYCTVLLHLEPKLLLLLF